MPTVTVATFNIRHGEGLDGRIDLDRIAGVMRATEADIIGLQELDAGLARSDRVDQARALAAKTGFHVSFHPTIEWRGGGYGIALATRADVETRFEPLPRLEDEEPRGAVSADVGGLRVFATHLSLARPARRAQIERLASLARETGGPVVVMGDMNCGRWGLWRLRLAGLRSDGRRHVTFQEGRRRHIDHILAGGGAKASGSSTMAGEASDHLPVRATVRY